MKARYRKRVKMTKGDGCVLCNPRAKPSREELRAEADLRDAVLRERAACIAVCERTAATYWLGSSWEKPAEMLAGAIKFDGEQRDKALGALPSGGK